MERGRSIEGNMERSGVAVYEVYTGQVDLGEEGAADQFRQDPDAYMKRFLEEQGFQVNGIGLRSSAGGPPEPSAEMRRAECRWWHEVWPNGSFWEYACY